MQIKAHVMVDGSGRFHLGTQIGRDTREGPFPFANWRTRPIRYPIPDAGLPSMQSFVCLTPHDHIRMRDATGMAHWPHPLKLKCSDSSASVSVKCSGRTLTLGSSVKAQLKVAQLSYCGPVVSPIDWWAQSILWPATGTDGAAKRSNREQSKPNGRRI